MKIENPHISVVIPVYGCAACLFELTQRLTQTLNAISEKYEIIYINDASPDNAWDIICELALKDPRIKGISLSRNFGQHYAITAGLDYACGEWIVVMDCDLQDMPEQIAKLYKKANEGFDVVVGRRVDRQDKYIKKIFSKAFYAVFSYFTGELIDNRIGNFGIYSRKVIKSIQNLREQNRSFGLFALWVGYKRVEIDIEHAPRIYGSSSYTFRKLMTLAMDSIVNHSDKLLRLTVTLGFALAVLSFLYGSWIVVRYFLWATTLVGWTSLIAFIAFSTGLIITTIGIVGLYVGKIFNEVKGRPLYLIDKTTFDNFEK